jgi:NAD(P)-dependent dehydrogenase (short-subunit alcohol dehydrogenase family)
VKHALVIGAAGDIGAAAASLLRARGWTVSGSDRREAAAWPPEGRWTTADITSQADRCRLWRSMEQPIDGLAIASGAIITGHFDQIEEEEWDTIFAVNAKAPFLLVRESLAHLSPSASIVFVGSLAGRRASPDNLAYGASKAALHSIAATLALALAPRGIRVNTVCPGLIDTGLTRLTTDNLSRLHEATPQEEEARRVSGIPFGRQGTPGEVAEAVEFLLSERSSYTSGALFPVSGGVPIGVP